MQQKTESTAAPPKVTFPSELRKHFYDTADWTTIIFVSVSLVFWMLVVSIIASRDWRDPAADLTHEDLLRLQDVVRATISVDVVPQKTEDLDLPDISNPEFEEMLNQAQANLQSQLAQTLESATAALAEIERAESAHGDAATGAISNADIEAELGALLGSLGDMDALGGMEDFGGPGLDLAPTDVAIFAEGATGSRVVAQAVDIGALGSDVQISSQFTRGGISAQDAARLSSQIQLARERLGGNVQIRVAAGDLGGTRRAALRVAGGSTGQRIEVEQLALPPAQAQGPGGRSQDAVEAQASRTRQLIGGCYTIGLASNPSLSGIVVVRFTIQPNGTVVNVQVSKSNLGNRDVEECIVAAVQTWKFAAGSGTDTFEYPFAFEPG